MANIVSGHILLTLIGNNFSLSNLSFFFILIFVQTLLILLEVGVRIIQAYVFSILLTLYSDESDYSLIH
jgi:F0F1-type ATP synthase membrane subunit a